ncbi:MAG: hypothetical protein CSA62_01925 [Planctomycetota bacterium]|nr:MAG: hypothetical protein CSA62_01925 [Planctomycetota bacterium]
MSRVTTSLFFAGLLAAGVAAQNDVIYYPFVSGKGKQVRNLANPSLPGTIVGSTVAKPWTTGKTNSALRGASNQVPKTVNAVDTGWKPNLKGDFTVAWFMKQENFPGTSLSYLFSNVGSFRCFTNGAARKGLSIKAWGGMPSTLSTSTDIQALAAKGWVHVACVVDWTGSKAATWYINGEVDKVLPLTAGANLIGKSNLFIGRHFYASIPWVYNTDEFRFSTRAASPAEVAAWAAMTPGGAGAYNVIPACGTARLAANGSPSLGNLKFQMTVTGPKGSPVLLSIGSDPSLKFDVGAIYPSLKGCQWASKPLFFLTSNTGAGTGIIPFPIPNNTAYRGVMLWNQALVLGYPSSKTQATNGLNLFIN